MAPKKALAQGEKVAVFSEVERAFYELQLEDCNQKLAQLRECVDYYEVRHKELQKSYKKLDEDRADNIKYLKKVLNVKNGNTELKEKIKYLKKSKMLETAKFKETFNELQHNFTRMKVLLSSQNKQQAGKIKTLEEFKAIKDNLMKKFEQKERDFEEQEMEYKSLIYDTEIKFINKKDNLKKEMEGRLLQLAQDFEDASELRIAASILRTIQENIALNNQLDSLLMTQAKVAEQNEKFREDKRASCCRKQVVEEERDKTKSKSMVQLKVIDQLTTAFEDVKKQKTPYDKKLCDQEKFSELQRLTKDNKNLSLRVRILEQNLHATLGEQNKSVIEIAKLLREREAFKRILQDLASAVNASLKMDNWAATDPSREIMSREVESKKILEVINQYIDAVEAQPVDSLLSHGNIYDKGDLRFEVKPAPTKKPQTVAATVLDSAASLLLLEDKRSAVSGFFVSPKGPKTVPSIQLNPVYEKPPPKESLASFAVTSLHSNVSSSVEESEDEMSKVSRMIALSKMDLQRSLIADLALSQSRTSHHEFSMSNKLNQNSVRMVAVSEIRASSDNTEQDNCEKDAVGT